MMLSSLFRTIALVPTAMFLSAATRRAGTFQSSPRLVAEASIWGADAQKRGKAFLPVTIEGHQATLIIDPNEEDIALSTAGMSRAGVSLSDTTTHLPALTIGSEVLHTLPIQLINDPTWRVRPPEGMGEVVGIVGAHILASHYDLLYDFPHQRVRLYAFPAKGETGRAALPPEVHSNDCGTLIPLPPQAPAFAAMPVLVDGHGMTGVIEWQPYVDLLNGGHDEKMNEAAFTVLGLPAHAPRIHTLPEPHVVWNDVPVTDVVTDVHITVGKSPIWTGPVKIFSTFEVNAFLPPRTPVMLLNLTTIDHSVLYYSRHSGAVCLNTPKP